MQCQWGTTCKQQSFSTDIVSNQLANQKCIFSCVSSPHSWSYPSLSPTRMQHNTSLFKRLMCLCSWAQNSLQYIGTMPNHTMQSNYSNSAQNLRNSNGKTFSDYQLPLANLVVKSAPQGFATQKPRVKTN